jgi:hypothetical protein
MDHIEIDKEDIRNLEYKFPSYPGAPRPPVRDRNTHGNFLKTGLQEAVSSITETRKNLGVDAGKLLILEFSSKIIGPDINLLQNKLNISIVEETQDKNNTSKLVIQFNKKEDIDVFERERTLYEIGSTDVSLLTPKQRSDIFACIDEIRSLSPEDRTGKRLLNAIIENNLPDDLFIVDIDVWYNGDIKNKSEIQGKVEQTLGTGNSSLLGDLFVLPNLLLGRAKVNRYTLQALRNLDLIAMIDFPIGVLSDEQCELYSTNFIPKIEDTLDDTAPLACVIDSGVFSGNPLLSSLIAGEEDFDISEKTPSDLNGHGTGVAGIVAYGDFHNFDKTNRTFRPFVRICNGKVMHNENGSPQYSIDKRPEQIVGEAIRYFHREYHCRIFNLSSGDIDRIYNGGRQMAWASLLDELSRELDIVVIVSAGNVLPPDIPNFTSRDELMSKSRDQLLIDKHRLIDPATTALGITVGSITRYGEPESLPQRPTPLSAGKAGYPSVFTRTGGGVNNAIKPEFVDYGGNLAIHQFSATQTSWRNNRALNEPSLSQDITQVFAGNVGTSLAAPHVTHIAARLERALQIQIGNNPSANLIRALLASSARYKEQKWLDAATPPDFQGEQKQIQQWRLNLSGYGKVDDTTLFTDRNHVTLFAEDALYLRKIHLYKIPVPKEFLDLRTNKRIAIGFAYNPPTQLSRKVYIANSLWFEVFRRIDIDMLLSYKGKKENSEEEAADKIIENFSDKYGAPFKPGHTEVKNSTLQQRVWEKSSRGGSDLLWEDNEPYIHILITGKAKFKHSYEQEAQPYALAVTFSYDNEEDIQLRQKLSEQVKIKQRIQTKIRPQIQIQ